MSTIETQISGSDLHLKVHIPRLDAASARNFKQECERIWQPEISRVTADMAEVGFIDSSGIGALLSLHKRLPASSGGVKLVNVQPPVQTVIELLRLHRIFEITT